MGLVLHRHDFRNDRRRAEIVQRRDGGAPGGFDNILFERCDHGHSAGLAGHAEPDRRLRKIAGEGYHRTWPDLLKMDPAVKARVDALLQGK